MKSLLRRFGIFFLLSLYGLSISISAFAVAPRVYLSGVNECVETLQEAFSVGLTDHSNQVDFHVVSTKEQNESNGFKGFPFSSDHCVCFLPVELVLKEAELIGKVPVLLQFDQTDIIFPFHYFF